MKRERTRRQFFIIFFMLKHKMSFSCIFLSPCLHLLNSVSYLVASFLVCFWWHHIPCWQCDNTASTFPIFFLDHHRHHHYCTIFLVRFWHTQVYQHSDGNHHHHPRQSSKAQWENFFFFFLLCTHRKKRRMDGWWQGCWSKVKGEGNVCTYAHDCMATLTSLSSNDDDEADDNNTTLKSLIFFKNSYLVHLTTTCMCILLLHTQNFTWTNLVEQPISFWHDWPRHSA